ncbi:MAG TPA: hypothetical protein VF163_07915 [Micromonosporaceae bacterium]
MLSVQAGIDDYEARYALARAGTSATVVNSESVAKGSDVIEVEWSDHNGQVRRHRFDVDTASEFPVGSALPIRISTSTPDEIFPDAESGIDETGLPRAFLIVLAVTTVGAATLWLRRAVQWWRAGRAPAKRHHAQVWYSYGRGDVMGVPWLAIEDGEQTYYQRVMWEAWVPSLNERMVVDGRRVGRGPFVVDVPGFGRLWPAGPAKPREPWLENLVPRKTKRSRLSRLGPLVPLSVVMVGLLGALTSWLFGLALAGYTWLLILYFGGAPTSIPWLPPRRFRRINRPGSPR